MKIKKTLLILTIIFLTLFSFKKYNNENLERFFINPKLGKSNFRIFKTNDSIPLEVIFKQLLKNDLNKNGIQIEYYFMTKDSILFAGGIEKINKNTIEILDQYIYLDNRQITANKIQGKTWKPLIESNKKFEMDFLDKKTGFSFETYSNANARIKDTLGQKSLIVEFTSKTIYKKDDKEFDNLFSKTTRLYFKDKGLVYYKESYNGNDNEFFLVKSN